MQHMNFWSMFKQLSKWLQVIIILSVLTLLLVAAFDYNAGENLIRVILALCAIFGTGRLINKEH